MKNTEIAPNPRRPFGLTYLVRFAFIAVGSLAVLVLSGCGGGGSGSAASTAAPVAASTVENVEIYPDSVTFTGSHSEESVGNYKIRVHSMNREFSLFRPANPDRKKLPLVIDLHGAGGVVKNGFSTQPWMTFARSNGFLFLQPQALNDANHSYTYWNIGWNIGRDDVAFIQTVLDIIIKQQDVDIDRIYLTGMSSGGFMSFYAGQILQDRIAAMAANAGTVLTTRMPDYTFKKPMPLLHIHGTADTVVSINGGPDYVSWWSLRQTWLNANKISSDPVITPLPDNVKTDNSTVTKYAYRGATAASDIDDYLIVNGNHSVPGIESYANQDINAYFLIWNFFKDRKLSDR